MKRAITLGALIFAVTGAARAENGPIEVDGGFINGTTEEGVRVFRGVPFAAPPVGDLRWRPPQPVADWDGVRPCVEFSPICPQGDYPEGSFYARPPEKKSEDCLYLNVWTDAESATDRRPVMVWIHGGGLTRGSASTPTYNGTALAKKGVVLVTVNYRLGPLGYLAHPELTAESKHGSSGNYGVLDQIAALQWVQRNIEKFGGDPDRVTIFGESAGSWSVNILVATPLAKGLFHRAIGESGGLFAPTTHLKDSDGDARTAEQIGVAFAKAAGVGSLAALRALPAEKIIEVLSGEGRGFQTRPNMDGWVLPDEIPNIFAAGQHNDVPVIVGSNAKEMTTLSTPASQPKSIEALHRRLVAQYGEKNAKRLAATYGAKNDADALEANLAIQRDVIFSLPMRTWARRTGKGDSPAYLYQFTRVPPIPNSEYLGAFHAAEIAYAFGNLGKSTRTYQKLDFKLSEVMSSYWVNFAATGDPNGEGLARWPQYVRETEPYLVLGDEVRIGHHLLKDELDLLESIGATR